LNVVRTCATPLTGAFFLSLRDEALPLLLSIIPHLQLKNQAETIS
jgi:hypothetical protein